ncbi:MAG: formimidoylglutamate deiminase [Hyphomicrobiales bacterium]
MQVLWAEQGLTADGWRKDLRVEIDAKGRITDIRFGSAPEGDRFGVLLPAPTNLHSHAFQRSMAGMTEKRGPNPSDSFWTWRELMFRFLDQLMPDDIEAITAFVQMEMLEAGYAAVGEFHYLHHQSGGNPYTNSAELCERIAAAAQKTGIGLTLLPVLYEHGGCDGRPLGPGQIRFGNNLDQFENLLQGAKSAVSYLSADANLGIAPHSLRAVSIDGLRAAVKLLPDKPLHMHVAEQIPEVDEVLAAWGKRPMNWLLQNFDVDKNWCLIHATQMLPEETKSLAQSGAVAGLCPITESSLGDGIFDGKSYLNLGGRFGVGSDSNIRISLSEELRTLEYSQRLRDHGRAVLATKDASTGRVLFEGAAAGGAQAAGRDSGRIEVGALADLLALDSTTIDLVGKEGDDILDSYIFCGDDSMVSDVWSAGRHLVHNGRHIEHESIADAYRQTILSLTERI